MLSVQFEIHLHTIHGKHNIGDNSLDSNVKENYECIISTRVPKMHTTNQKEAFIHYNRKKLVCVCVCVYSGESSLQFLVTYVSV